MTDAKGGCDATFFGSSRETLAFSVIKDSSLIACFDEGIGNDFSFASTQPIPALPSREIRDCAAPSYEDSPLSASSVIANPPTPCNRLSIPLSEDLKLPPSLPPNTASIPETKCSSHEPSPVNSSPIRQTETFKMVRGLSGNVYASGETISAAGQQWEIVESVEAKGNKSSKTKEQETGSRRELKAESRSKADVEHGDYRHSHSHQSSKMPYYRRGAF